MKINLNSFLFEAAYVIWIIAYLLTYTNYPTSYPALTGLLGIMARLPLVLMLIKLILDRTISRDNLRQLMILLPIVLFVALRSDYVLRLLQIFLFIFGAKGIDLKRILKLHLIIFIGVLALTFFGYKAGVIPNIIDRSYANRGIRIRYGEGFRFATFGANIAFYLTCIYVYLRAHKIRLWEFAFFAALNYYYYVRTDTRFAFYGSIALLLAALLVKQFKIKLSPKISYGLEVLLAPVLASLALYLTWAYSHTSGLYNLLNKFLSNRLYLGNLAIQKYGIRLFGNKIVWNTELDRGTYFYVDSSFVNILLNFGIIFLAIIFISFALAYKKNTYRTVYFTLAFAMVMVRCMWDPQLLELWFNPFLLFLAIPFSQSKEDLELAALNREGASS